MLLKFVEENYPLPEKPEPLPCMCMVSVMALCIFLGSSNAHNIAYLSNFCIEESVKELQRKRHSATPGVSFRGRVRKAAKWQTSDQRSDEESDS